MNPRDIKDFKDATKEIYSFFFSNKVEYRYMLEEVKPNIYGEVKKGARQYSDPIILTARVNLSPEIDEIRAKVGSSTKVNAKFEIPAVYLEEHGMLDKSLIELKRGKITFNGVDYYIQGIFPVTNIDEIFLFYEFETGGKEDV